jgi:L-seryl-tRNA(Ser) seleniumtransferase
VLHRLHDAASLEIRLLGQLHGIEDGPRWHAGAAEHAHRLAFVEVDHRLRGLPSVDDVLKAQAATLAVARFGRSAALIAVRQTLQATRAALRAGRVTPSEPDAIASTALAKLSTDARSNFRPVFNLTGTVLHTNLGRALVAEAAVEAAVAAMRSAVALEFDLATGKRGERDDHLRGLLCELTGAEDATVVNNNAAAVVLVLNTLAKGREAVVSRGELIEIGGAFRMPDIMARAGTRLREIGTTNRTHRKDYAEAISPRTALVLKVHTSNYIIPRRVIAAATPCSAAASAVATLEPA